MAAEWWDWKFVGDDVKELNDHLNFERQKLREFISIMSIFDEEKAEHGGGTDNAKHMRLDCSDNS